MNSYRWIAGIAAGLLLSTSLAHAGGFALREQSTIGQGLSFAGVAAGAGGLSSMFWNPAVSAEYNEYGFISENNVNLILPSAEAEFGGNSSGNIGEWAIVPAGSMSYGLTDKITLGLTTGAPFGLTTNGNDSWAGVLRGDKSEVMTLNATPSVSYKLNDMLSIGVGVQLQYMSAELTSRAPNAANPFFEVEGDDFGFGFTAGLLFEPTDTTDIGIGFRSSVRHKLEGEGSLGALLDQDISAKFTAPEIVTVGVRQEVSDQLALSAGLEWSNWSRFKEFRVNGLPGVVEAYNWKDGWFASIGAEYAYSDALTLRAGAAFERSPVPDETRGVRVPDNDRYWLSLGASYRISEKMTANLAYSHVFMEDGDVDLTGAPLAIQTSFDQHVDIISLGLTRDW
jgi:long-chain fatty acid transport protein